MLADGDFGGVMERSNGIEQAGQKPWWLAAIVVAIGGIWLYGSSLLPQTANYARVGPGLYLTIVGIGLVILGIILGVQIARGERFEAQDAEDASANEPAHWPSFWTAVAAASFPLYTMERFGFILTSALMFALTTRAFGSKKLPLDLLIGAVIGGIAWYGFSLLGVGLGEAYKIPKAAEWLPTLLQR
jgi:putative tricarboxylic transport membrane protein